MLGLWIGELSNLKFISAGIIRCLSEERVRSVVELVGNVANLGVDVLDFFDESAMKLLRRRLITIVNNGTVAEAVTLLETLAAVSMEPSNNQKSRRNTRIPPKRGQIKARIVREFVKLITKAASKAAGKASCMQNQIQANAAEQEVVGRLPEPNISN